MGYTFVSSLFTFCALLCSSTGENPNLFGVPGEGYIIETYIGTPRQKFNVLVDTGSANFAVAGASNPNVDHYFEWKNSSSHIDNDKTVSVLYTQGSWSGKLGSDVVLFPTLEQGKEIRCDIAFITESKNFYMNGSKWQGILGVAYPAISRPNPQILTWIDSLQRTNNDNVSAFSLKLCGMKNDTANEHYGYFKLLNNRPTPTNKLLTTPIVKEWFYEILMTGIRVANYNLPIDCKELNKEKTIVDSGTTYLRLPNTIFEVFVQEIMIKTKVFIEEAFWFDGKLKCWDERIDWDSVMPNIGIEIMNSKDEYLLIDLPGSSYIRQMLMANQFCYKFGVESSTSSTILGVVVMEGFEVLFNRTAKTIGFQKTNCGPNVSITGPHKADHGLIESCSRDLNENMSLLEIAAYIVCALLLIASLMFSYLLMQWLKYNYFRFNFSNSSVSLSNTNLMNYDE